MIVTGRTDWSLSRRSWPVWLGIGLIAVLVSTSTTFGLGSAVRHVSFGNKSETVTTNGQTVYGGFGNLTVDATGLKSGQKFTVNSVAGNVTVKLPPNTHLTVNAHASPGTCASTGSTRAASAPRSAAHHPGDRPGPDAGRPRVVRADTVGSAGAPSDDDHGGHDLPVPDARVTVGTFFLLLGAPSSSTASGVFRVRRRSSGRCSSSPSGAGMLLHRARRLQVEEDRSAQLAGRRGAGPHRPRAARHRGPRGVADDDPDHRRPARGVDQARTRPSESLEAAEHTGRQTLNELEGMLAVLRGADASIWAAAGRRWRRPGRVTAGADGTGGRARCDRCPASGDIAGLVAISPRPGGR